jgi:sulfopyruvate decarboxylase TPP-binding subunit
MGSGRELSRQAIGMVSGAWMAGLRGCIMMQTSGFGTLPNALDA